MLEAAVAAQPDEGYTKYALHDGRIMLARTSPQHIGACVLTSHPPSCFMAGVAVVSALVHCHIRPTLLSD